MAKIPPRPMKDKKKWLKMIVDTSTDKYVVIKALIKLKMYK